VGSPTFSADTKSAELGPVTVPLEGGLPLKLSIIDAPDFSYGYMVISYRSSYGEELGRIQVWPRDVPTCYLMGAGLKVRDPFGVIVLKPGTLNRRHMESGSPQVIRVVVDMPAALQSDYLTPPGFSDPGGGDLFFTPIGAAGRLTYPK